ncbi:Rhodanese-like domain-containing protein 4, chloroplastic [Apostasia shenzhenica]|uniref:Rhodanese-like domain-containing protein 4, chloroplastic n=1 Tax=Apostasia shenzhenica TaxID=1088818 RepID=A0A2I0AJI8_9ASPA|nr:Rhodanese-like domain-containing protein 4, chloroplastic [Apostasia shenzhenica]
MLNQVSSYNSLTSHRIARSTSSSSFTPTIENQLNLLLKFLKISRIPSHSHTPKNNAMEVLNAACLASVSLPKISATTAKGHEARRLLLPSAPLKPCASVLRGIGEGMVAFSSAFSVASFAGALTYEEAVRKVVGFSQDLDLAEFFDRVLKYGSENPLIIGGGVAVVAVPLVLSLILSKAKPWGVESAKRAYAKLAQDADAQLLDIREGREVKEAGSPDLRELKNAAVAIPYRREDKPAFLKKLALKFKDPGNTVLFVFDKFDKLGLGPLLEGSYPHKLVCFLGYTFENVLVEARFDGNSELVAELATTNGFKAAFAIKDGAEGARGWKNSGLPWLPPKKTLSLDFGELRDSLSSSLGDTSVSVPVAIGVAAATGLGLFAFTEVETLLQLLGSAAIFQLITKKLLFAEDRKVTLQQVDEFLNTKVAPKELVDEIKTIGKALLPSASSSQLRLPVPSDDISETSPIITSEQSHSSVVKSEAESKEDAATEANLAVNSVPRSELEKTVLISGPRPLSPYPYVLFYPSSLCFSYGWQ